MATISRDIKERKEVKEKETKRRRTIKTEARAPSPEVPSKKVKVDAKHGPPPADMFYLEEDEAKERALEVDLKIHQKACEEIRKTMANTKQAKDKGSPNKDDLEESRIHGTLQFVTLKKLNRIAHMRCKREREATNEAKQKIDQHHLQLQNLLYEVMHLQKEITKCLEFKSKDEDINLVPLEEFYSTAPSNISKPDVTKKDVHKQTLARLDWELEQRKRLSEKLKDAQSAKKDIAADIEKKREYLESLQPKLGTILNATKPVQEYLDMPFDEVREQHRMAHYLPQPLYVLYMQATAYHEACDKKMKVIIQGDAEVAKTMETAASDVEEDSDSDQEDTEKSNGKRRRRGSNDRRGETRQKLLKKHPLSIVITITGKDGSSLDMTFYYIIALNIVTVSLGLNISNVVSSISGGDLLSTDLVLNCLYPGDTGNNSPNPGNEFILNKLALGEFAQYVKDLGRPYKWVQTLCGLDFVNTVTGSGKCSDVKAQTALSGSHIEETIKRLRTRISARLALQKVLSSLERNTIPIYSEDLAMFPAKILVRLRDWQRGTYADYCELPYTDAIQSADLVNETDMIFFGVLERGSAKMTFHVVVSADYPATAPIFAVSINWSNTRTNKNDESIRDLEAEVNIYYDELVTSKTRDQLLPNQLQRLAMCFDVYLESNSDNAAMEGPVEFSKEKIFPRLTRGPQRSRPFKYNASLGFFSQR